MNILLLARGFLIVFGATLLGGIIAGSCSRLLSIPLDYFPLLIGLTNMTFGAMGFFIEGLLKHENRGRHMLKISFLVWLASLINLYYGAIFIQWLFSLVFILIQAGIGYGAAILAKPTQTTPSK